MPQRVQRDVRQPLRRNQVPPVVSDSVGIGRRAVNAAENVVVRPEAAQAELHSNFELRATVLGEYLKTDEGLPPAKGQTYRLPGGAFFEIRGGKIARVTNYYNLQDWLRQVGAS